jgi:gliding motility-associated-like protein
MTVDTGTQYYTDSLKTFNNCDSIVTLQLTVHPVYNDTINAEICLGESYNKPYFDTVPTTAGFIQWTQNRTTIDGCDSITTLNLTVHPVYHDTIVAEICLTEGYYLYGFDTLPTSVGFIQYTNYYSTEHGCDSTRTLQLTVNPVYDDTINATICLHDTYNLYGFDVTPSSAGFYTFVKELTTKRGCDSTVTLLLTVNPSYEIFWQDTIYEDEYSYIGENQYNTGGRHTVLYMTSLDCDSIINLDLYIIYYPSDITAFTPNGDGVNDYFMPGFKVQVFNRYGTLIYETRTPEERELGWDGRDNSGYKVAPGMYFYILYNASDKPRFKSSVEVLKR